MLHTLSVYLCNDCIHLFYKLVCTLNLLVVYLRLDHNKTVSVFCCTQKVNLKLYN